VDIASLVYFRIVFGAVMLWEVWRYFDHDWIRRYYVEPQFLFKYHGFGWVDRLPGEWMVAHFALLGLLAACILAGLRYRAAAALFFLGFAYVFLVAQARYLNHFYLILLVSFLMVFVPAGRAFSLDARRDPSIRSGTAPGWALWLLRTQIGIVYFYGGLAKLNGDWLRGEPMRTWLLERTDLSLVGPLFTSETTVYAFVLGGLLLDLLVVPMLLWRPTRVAACFGLLVFHLLNARLFQIGIFPWFMLLATPIFLPPELPRRAAASVRERWAGRRFRQRQVHSLSPASRQRCGSAESGVSGSVPGGGRDSRDERRSQAGRHGPAANKPPVVRSPARERLTLGLVAAYVALQLLVPLRHHLYPGDVAWTEEGHRFSWRMKLRDKEAHAVFVLTDPASGRTWTVDPLEYLFPWQREEMVSRPGMILQFSHFLAREKRKEGYRDVEVRAFVPASLNGRNPQLLVDPALDLTRERRTLTPARWILPLAEPPELAGATLVAPAPDGASRRAP
jgi:hypothetical protein